MKSTSSILSSKFSLSCLVKKIYLVSKPENTNVFCCVKLNQTEIYIVCKGMCVKQIVSFSMLSIMCDKFGLDRSSNSAILSSVRGLRRSVCFSDR